ncbi:rCG23311 [Rattus norvegicus]|uniref:RCG23311 n=1 Tax=Rattus norvegicus TaxID=10116 RepID=A6JQ99_RAT|nr:rCG23311 [Rattus norvegicus]
MKDFCNKNFKKLRQMLGNDISLKPVISKFLQLKVQSIFQVINTGKDSK